MTQRSTRKIKTLPDCETHNIKPTKYYYITIYTIKMWAYSTRKVNTMTYRVTHNTLNAIISYNTISCTVKNSLGIVYSADIEKPKKQGVTPVDIYIKPNNGSFPKIVTHSQNLNARNNTKFENPMRTHNQPKCRQLNFKVINQS